jgi:hypothetical protein
MGLLMLTPKTSVAAKEAAQAAAKEVARAVEQYCTPLYQKWTT